MRAVTAVPDCEQGVGLWMPQSVQSGAQLMLSGAKVPELAAAGACMYTLARPAAMLDCQLATSFLCTLPATDCL